MIEIDRVAAVAREAGERILEVARQGARTREKEDGSPVTDADEAAHRTIVRRLRSLTPGIPVVSEESAQPADAGGAPRFWLVDPLDGTREFVDGNDEYTVNIALVEAGAPVLGVVLARRAACFMAGRRATARGASTGMRRERRSRCEASPRADRSRRSAGRIRTREPMPGSQGWRHGDRARGIVAEVCLIAEGTVDVYPRLGRTREWDTAAAHAVLSAAGGSVSTLAGSPLTYGKPASKIRTSWRAAANGLPSSSPCLSPANPAPVGGTDAAAERTAGFHSCADFRFGPSSGSPASRVRRLLPTGRWRVHRAK